MATSTKGTRGAEAGEKELHVVLTEDRKRELDLPERPAELDGFQACFEKMMYFVSYCSA